MAIENKAKIERLSVNKKFLQNFHDDVLSSGKQGKEGENTVTMKIVSVGDAPDRHYLLPSYDPKTGKIVANGNNLIDKYRSLIESGVIKGYSSAKEAELDRKIIYPQIIGKK
tara:strand:+ start:3569 stop:3904 length:336 start_codon:yes stop_codon:yes gene_type:complete